LEATAVVDTNEEGVVHDAQLVKQGDVLVDLIDEDLSLLRTQGNGLTQPIEILVLHDHVGVVFDLPHHHPQTNPRRLSIREGEDP
jgi:hypothetical protein